MNLLAYTKNKKSPLTKVLEQKYIIFNIDNCNLSNITDYQKLGGKNESK